MIKHYALITFAVDEQGMVEMALDHSLLLEKFGGVAYDTEAGKWLSPSQLLPPEDAHDSEFLRFVGNALANAMPSEATMEVIDNG